MKLIKSLTLFGIVTLLTTMCGNQSKQENESQEKYIEFKSAIHTKEITSGDYTLTIVDYIDDYGDVWYQYSSRNDGVGNMLSTSIDGYDYTCFLDMKTGIKSLSNDDEVINWLNLSDAAKQHYQIKSLGQEEYMGKMCDVYSMITDIADIPAKYWIWKGLTLKMETQMNDEIYVTSTVDLKTDVEIPAEKVTLPEDIVFEER